MLMEPAVRRKPNRQEDPSIGRIVSVTGSRAIVLLDDNSQTRSSHAIQRSEMGTLLGIDTPSSIVLGLVSALSVPVPAHKEGDPEVWIAELGLVGELPKDAEGNPGQFSRGVSVYPTLGDRVRIATKRELAQAFSASSDTAVRVGVIRQDASIPAMIKTDDLLGKHFAILGTTGTGKSCTTALILRAILEKNRQAHIVLLDPHNEYASSFSDMAEVVSPRDMHLPFWLLTFEELVEVLINDAGERKHEVEILQELVPICKTRYSNNARSREGHAKLKRSAIQLSKFTVDTPVPYRISDLVGILDERMGMLENKKDLSPYRNLKTRIETILQDQRYSFMFGSLTVNDSMAQVLGRLYRVPVNDKPITIMQLTGLPTEIVNVVVSVLCRMTFDFALWGEGQVPVLLVCEEAHRYVPANATVGFEPAKRAIARIAKEGRKYGASLCIVTQRPAEIDSTILSQCNTVFALRMSNDRDQQIVQSAIADTGSGLLEFLPALGAREAIAFGDGVTLPVRIKFDEMPKKFLPKSSTAQFSAKWREDSGDEALLNTIVERWRSSGGVAVDAPMDMNSGFDGLDQNFDGSSFGDAAARAETQASMPQPGHSEPATSAGLIRRRELLGGGEPQPAPQQIPPRTGSSLRESLLQPRAARPDVGEAPKESSGGLLRREGGLLRRGDRPSLLRRNPGE